VPALVFVALATAGLLYRAVLIAELFTVTVTPVSFVANRYTFLLSLRLFFFELLFAGVVAAIVAVGVRLGRGLAGHRWARGVGWALAYAVVGLIGFVDGVHHDLLFAAHVGFGYDVILEGWSTSTPRDAYGYASRLGILFLLAPVALLTLLRLLPAALDAARARLMYRLSGVSLVLVLPTIVLVAFDLDYDSIRWPVRAVPIQFVADDVGRRVLGGEGQYAKLQRTLPAVAGAGPRLEGSPWTTAPRTPPLSRPEPGTVPWNVVFVVMESVGARYPFDDAHAGVVPMPFLKRLAGEGLHLEAHYASANTSPRSIFTLMSGVYALPQMHMFCTRPDVVVPGLGAYLGDEYDRFLVTPSRLQSYFPRAFLEHSGVREMYGYYTIPETQRAAWPGGRHELDATDHFLARMKSAQEPFFATYYSYAPHYHYYDYGPEYRISKGTEPLDRYYDNLRLLDAQIRRIYEQLEASGRLERTVLLLVGDHGEAFGQHPGNWTHSRQSFDENVRAPAIFYQPALFAPARVTELTSHVDILPTLLDAIGVGAPPERFQGDSLFRGLRSEYVFFYGNEGTLSSVSRDRMKVQVLFKTDTCRAFDLATDPTESVPLDCAAHRAQLEAMLRFGRFQTRALPAYNQRLHLREGGS